MYAIIKTGGKQYRVAEGESIKVEKLGGGVGDKVHFDEVLLASAKDKVELGTPLLEGRVSATIEEQGKNPKILVFKFKRRKMYRRKRGHRQCFTRVKIDKIELGAAEKEAAS